MSRREPLTCDRCGDVGLAMFGEPPYTVCGPCWDKQTTCQGCGEAFQNNAHGSREATTLIDGKVYHPRVECWGRDVYRATA